MKSFKVEPLAQLELDEAAGWYERKGKRWGFSSSKKLIARSHRDAREVCDCAAAHCRAWRRSERVCPALPVCRRLRGNDHGSPGDHDPPRECQPGKMAIATLVA
ncbi:MAG: hypothetical protein ABIY55_25100, partial [Kofleriaceae bacterium]